MRVLKYPFLFLILFYQYLISPLLGPRCRFHPTCSSYIYRCFQLFPIHIALWYGVKRLLKCHPFHSGGHDPVPCNSKCSEVKNTNDFVDKSGLS